MFKILMQLGNSRNFFCVKSLKQIRNGVYLFNSKSRSFHSNQNWRTYHQQVPQTFENVLKNLERENRVNLNLVKQTLPTATLGNLSDIDIITLLDHCGDSVPYYTKYSRNQLCQEIYKKLIDEGNKSLTVYCKYIQMSSVNDFTIIHSKFLSDLQKIRCQPDTNILKCLLHNACETDDINQSIEILNMMRAKEIGLDENDFCALVRVHTIERGLKGGEAILDIMKDFQISQTNQAIFALYKGLVKRYNEEEFVKATNKYKFPTEPTEFLKILETIALTENLKFLQKILEKYSTKLLKENVLKVDLLCIHLINMGKPEAAMMIYSKLIEPNPDKKYAHFLLREMFICSTRPETSLTEEHIKKISGALKERTMPILTIINWAKNIRDFGFNPYAVENSTEIALRLKKFDAAYLFLNEFLYYRTHFFWPFLANAAHKHGEAGVIDLLQDIINKNIAIDRETLYNYVIPNCNLSDPKLLVNRLQKLGVTVRDIVPCLIIVLLETNKIDMIEEICQSFNVKIYDEKLLNLLPFYWQQHKNNVVVTILQRLSEANPTEEDLVGYVLLKIGKQCNSNSDFQHFLPLLESISNIKLRINSISADSLTEVMVKNCKDYKLTKLLTNTIDDLEDHNMKIEQNIFVHPRDMNLEQLECHLEELKHKNMETRGVLRRLIQQHCSHGNHQRVEDLREEFIKLGYEETPGMKSALFHTYTKTRNLEAALKLYGELKKEHPAFNVDLFKIIDLVTLMVQNDKYYEAKELFKQAIGNRKIYPDEEGIRRNCHILLSTFQDDKNQMEMFKFLVSSNICKPSNVLLGPLVRIFLDKGEIQKASDTFLQLANEYNCTPLQLELIMAVLDIQNEQILQKVLDVSIKIHGEASTRMSLIAGLAEKNLDKLLIKFLSTPNIGISTNELSKRCNRWIKEEKLEPLFTLRKCMKRLFRNEIEIVDLSIMKIFGVQNKCDAALDFYEELVESEHSVSEELELELWNLFKKCKKKLPESIRLKKFKNSR